MSIKSSSKKTFPSDVASVTEKFSCYPCACAILIIYCIFLAQKRRKTCNKNNIKHVFPSASKRRKKKLKKSWESEKTQNSHMKTLLWFFLCSVSPHYEKSFSFSCSAMALTCCCSLCKRKAESYDFFVGLLHYFKGKEGKIIILIPIFMPKLILPPRTLSDVISCRLEPRFRMFFTLNSNDIVEKVCRLRNKVQ